LLVNAVGKPAFILAKEGFFLRIAVSFLEPHA